MELPHEVQTRIEKIALLSPSARKVLETDHTALAIYDVEWDPDAVRQEMFVALVNDLEYLGIYFSCTIAEAFGPTWHDFDKLMELLSYIFPNQLYPKLQRDKKLRDLLKHVLWGVSDEPLLQTWLETIALYHPSLKDTCRYFSVNMNASPVFTVLLENMNNLIQQECLNVIHTTHDPAWDQYKSKIISQAYYAYEYLVKEVDVKEEVKDLLKRRLTIYLEKELNTFHEIDKYKFLFTTDLQELAPECLEYWRKVYYEFCVSNKLLPEYYTVREIKPTYADILGILIYQFASSKNSSTLSTVLQHIKQTFPFLNESFDLICQKLIELKETFHDRSD